MVNVDKPTEQVFLTSDGVPFHLGMTLYRYDGMGDQIVHHPTSKSTHWLDIFEYDGVTIAAICRIGSKTGIDTRRLAATRQGAVAAPIRDLRYEIAKREQKILELEALAGRFDQ